jgi:hypothetical protein
MNGTARSLTRIRELKELMKNRGNARKGASSAALDDAGTLDPGALPVLFGRSITT